MLEGHPTPLIPWVDVATGSLGQGLPDRRGHGARRRRTSRSCPTRVWVLCGDSEMAEGSMWEAFEHAAHYGLDNLTAIIDVNRLGQRGETMVGWDLDTYVARAEAFGWHAIEVDGHDVEAIDEAYAEAVATTGQPTVVVARTKKGKGVAAVEDKNGLHGKPLDDPDAAIAELGGLRDIRDRGRRSRQSSASRQRPAAALELPRYELGDGGRDAQGLRRRARRARHRARPDVVALDGEVSNSTYAETFAKAHPERYFEMYIAEQQMVAAAVGLQAVGWTPFASTFAAFLTRAYDFVRMAAISRATLALCGSHAGVSIGEDGPSQMGLEDIASLRAVHGVDGPPPVRREPDRAARRRDGRDRGHLVPPHAPARDARALPAGRGVRDRRQPRPALERRRRGRADRRRHHGARGAEGRRHARRGGDRRAGHRPVLDQAGRRRDARRRQPRRPAAGS